MTETSQVSDSKTTISFEQLADALVKHYESEPASDGEKLEKIEAEAKAWNTGVREDQKVTPEEVEEAKKKLGLV